MILAYRIFSIISYPFLFLFIYFRLILKKEDPRRFKEKLLSSHFNVKRKENSKLIWFHAASIGEFKSIIPIIKKLDSYEKNLEFLITTTTFSSSNLAKLELANFENMHHRFFPFDVIFLIDKFINVWKPKKIFLVDSEVWPNLIIKANQKGIPLALINARLSRKSFKRWLLFPNTAKKIFGMIDLFLCANKETKGYLEKLKIQKVNYEGNIKLISKINFQKIDEENEKRLEESRFWIAASIHKEEDIFCLKTHKELKNVYNDIITVLAPRHIDRVNKIKSLSEKLGFKTQILNKDDKIFDENEVIIINFFGNLQNYFKYAKSVFIGKSTIDKIKHDSGQSPIDAAKLNCKIYHGPYVSNFQELYDDFRINNISNLVEDHHDLSKNLIIDLKKISKKEITSPQYIKNLERDVLINTMKLINNFLYDEIN